MNPRANLLPMTTALALLAILPGAFDPISQAASRAVDQQQAADPNGTVEIVNVAGSVTVTGWDRPEVAVTGQIGDRVDRVEISSSDHHTLVRVVLPHGIGLHFGGDGSAHLTIRVPTHSDLEVSLVSSDLTVTGVSGPQQLRTVSGDIKTDGGAAAHITSVSGDVRLSTPTATAAQIETMSGDLTVNGPGGDVSISTVSGGGHLKLGALHSFRLSTVSGDFDIDAHLDDGGQFTTESVNGDIKVAFSGAPAAAFDLRSLSGDISNCTAQRATQSQFGPGSRLSFSTGDGQARVSMSSTSGDLSLCAR
jgi:hypothetical protein